MLGVPFPPAVVIHQQTAPSDGPIAFVGVADFCDHLAIGILQADVLSAVAESTFPVPDYVGHIGVVTAEGVQICRHDQIAARRDRHIGKSVFDPASESPTVQVNRPRLQVEKLDILLAGVFRRGVVQDLVDNHPKSRRILNV